MTEELGFESDEEAARFVCDNGCSDSLEEREGVVWIATGKARPIFEAQKAAAFKVVDIKGQI